MAGVVKWLRPRIVVPICMGSNPISRPIKSVITYVMTDFILHDFWMRTAQQSLVGFERERTEAEVLLHCIENTNNKPQNTFKRE